EKQRVAVSTATYTSNNFWLAANVIISSSLNSTLHFQSTIFFLCAFSQFSREKKKIPRGERKAKTCAEKVPSFIYFFYSTIEPCITIVFSASVYLSCGVVQHNIFTTMR
ncbi:Uncharacterized protein TCM_021626, partial [Theobroma cacao]